MTRRAESMDATRRRITEAAVRLHTTVGPSAASIAAVAAEAGVTRLTVYRHFGDQESLFGACMAHWSALHPRPDPSKWAEIAGLGARVRHALTDLYGWYADVGDEFYPIQRDFEHVPPAARARSGEQVMAYVRAILDGPSSGSAAASTPSLAAGDLHRLEALVGHLVSFMTWRSLVVEHGLTQAEAVAIAVEWVEAVVSGSTS